MRIYGGGREIFVKLVSANLKQTEKEVSAVLKLTTNQRSQVQLKQLICSKPTIVIVTLCPMSSPFAARTSVDAVEEGMLLAPKFDTHGLIPVVTTDADNGEVLMHAYMNQAALLKTLETGEAHYYSRSRQQLWHKGATSGLVQNVQQLLIDDDQDCLWMKVKVLGSGASCHVGYRSCFYRQISLREGTLAGPVALTFTETTKTFDPVAVYGDAPNPTQL